MEYYLIECILNCICSIDFFFWTTTRKNKSRFQSWFDRIEWKYSIVQILFVEKFRWANAQRLNLIACGIAFENRPFEWQVPMKCQDLSILNLPTICIGNELQNSWRRFIMQKKEEKKNVFCQITVNRCKIAQSNNFHTHVRLLWFTCSKMYTQNYTKLDKRDDKYR